MQITIVWLHISVVDGRVGPVLSDEVTAAVAQPSSRSADLCTDHGGMMTAMRIRIDAVDLPGLACPASVDGTVPAYGNIHVAVQRRDRPAALLAPQPGDAPYATWTLECTTSASPSGTEVKGPYVQNRLGRRFIY